MPFTPHELQVIKELTKFGLPAFVVAAVLDTTTPRVSYARKKNKWAPGRGKTYGRNFVFTFKTEEFPFLVEDEQRRYRALWNELIRDAAAGMCTVRFETDDVNPIDVIRLYRNLLPAVAIRELLGLTEKRFARLCRTLGAMPDASRRASLAKVLHRDSAYINLSSLSPRQQVRLEGILTRKREEYRKRRAALMKVRAENLWSTLVSLRSGHSAPRVICRGKHCKKRSENDRCKWPRTNEFFYATTDTPDGLGHFCKYCQLIHCQKRRGAAVCRRRAKSLKPDELKRIVAALKKWNGQVPTIYIEALFELTRKQFSRLYRLAGISTPAGSGQSRLWQWRVMKEEDFPELPGLSDTGRERLREIWRADVKAWRKQLEAEEEVLLFTMEEEDARIQEELRSGETGKPSPARRPCAGGCGRKWHESKLCFPPTLRRYRGLCHLCLNREIRKQPM